MNTSLSNNLINIEGFMLKNQNIPKKSRVAFTKCVFIENFNVFTNNTICVEAVNFRDTMYGILETAKSIWNERRTFHDASCHRSGKMLS